LRTSGRFQGAGCSLQMAGRERKVGRNGQFGRLAKSAGVRRNPHEYAGTGAIRQDARRRSSAERSQADPKGERHQWRAKKNPNRERLGFC